MFKELNNSAVSDYSDLFLLAYYSFFSLKKNRFSFFSMHLLLTLIMLFSFDQKNAVHVEYLRNGTRATVKVTLVNIYFIFLPSSFD